MTSEQPAGRERPHWGRIIITSLLGLTVLGGTFGLSDAADHVALWQAIGIEAGMVLLLLAVVFFLERGLMVRVRRDVTAAVQPLTARVDDLSGTLQELVDARLREQRRRHASSVEALAVPTYEAVRDAVIEAEGLNGLVDGVTVQASSAGFGPRVSFHNVTVTEPATGQQRPELQVTAFVGDMNASVDWSPEESLDLVALELDNALRRAGVVDPQQRHLDWNAIQTNLRDTLTVAFETDGWRPAGALHELIGRWAITSAGLEHRNRGIVIPVDHLPARARTGRGAGHAFRGPNPDWAEWTHPKPDWADDAEWHYVLDLAKNTLPPIPDVLGLQTPRPHRDRTTM